MLAEALRESGLLEFTADMFNVGMFLVGTMILVQGLRERSRGVEVGFALGVAAIAIIGFARGISAAERSHLIEYTVLALIVHEALLERRDQGRRVPVPAVTTDPSVKVAVSTIPVPRSKTVQNSVPDTRMIATPPILVWRLFHPVILATTSRFDHDLARTVHGVHREATHDGCHVSLGIGTGRRADSLVQHKEP